MHVYILEYLNGNLIMACVIQVYSVSTVLYRTLKVNDCPDAAKELLEEIDMARAELKRKGMKSLQ